ncbi:hypothetical protein L1987_81489 [Smallanthus sonchifolius]|uniref:Uncharacterized protein n=1 Tax=Smallanthus sonchifolius TaxID=185202 RepID=A0ACB8YQQ8_9ASTR|nr:hypothetical protein L1987_81489 [Smallanthus sonchifolius]
MPCLPACLPACMLVFYIDHVNVDMNFATRVERNGRTRRQHAVVLFDFDPVTYESFFSTSGRVLDPFRSCMTPMIVHSLIGT